MKKLIISLLLLSTTSAMAQEVEKFRLKPRIEGNVRAGNERTIGMTEVWIPLVQDDRTTSVLYGDIRLMDDSQDNNEGNIGVGYRQMVTNTPLGDGIAGANVWYDRRHTDLGTNFNQITVGAEWFSDSWDAKANAYIPLNKKKDYVGAIAGGGGFTGTQIVAYGNQNLTEEALMGFDFELGWRVPFMDEYTDSTRIYGGGYHFTGDDADDVTGYRARIASDVTEDVQLGTRFQHDDERGSQGFLEATIRFPFGNKQSYKEQGLKARLDESPERDIDIVSGQAVTGTRTTTVLNNATTGTAQEIWHVDNTAAGGGNGSAETPFNTLAAAVAVAGTNDVIYVHRGNGTSTGQNAGVVINDVGQKLIGSGVAVTPSLINLSTSGVSGLTSNTTLIAAGTAPVITNGAGNVVSVTADRAVVAGISANNAGGGANGINVDNSSGTTWNSFKAAHVTLNNNAGSGFYGGAFNAGSQITNFTLDNVVASGNGASGVTIETATGTIGALTATDVNTSGNVQVGFYVTSTGTAGSITGTVSRLRSSGNTDPGAASGVLVWIRDDTTASLSFSNSTVTNNTNRGFLLLDDSTGNVVVDLGGGTLGSTGQNSIFGNTGPELDVDLDGGVLKAENNWWGVNTGLAGGETTLVGGSTVDASPFRTSAP
ncbi:MAG: hypothetical protein EBQ96_10070 [Proteobacteria bacterium]|nr:hypothetical protein [Pseudomonadota bacterium]